MTISNESLTAIRSHLILAMMLRFDELPADHRAELTRDYDCPDFDAFIAIAISDRDADSDDDDLLNSLLSAFKRFPNFDDDAANLISIRSLRMLTDS